jgi:hypothetical protein
MSDTTIITDLVNQSNDVSIQTFILNVFHIRLNQNQA